MRREARVGVVVLVRRAPFQYYLILPVAVNVAHACVVGRVSIFAPVGRYAPFGLLQLYRQVAFGRAGRQRVSAVFPPASYLVCCVGGQRTVVDIECAARGQRLPVQFHPVAVNVERFALLVGVQRPPAHYDVACVLPHGHDAPVQLFPLYVGHVVAWLCACCGTEHSCRHH